MSKFQRHIEKEVQQWRMSGAEKSAMREALVAHMEAHPLGAVRSPFAWYSFSARQLVAVPLVVFLLFGGTAYAAQGALPGDALYPVKIHVNEAVSGALAVSDSQKAQWNVAVAAERVKEAQALAAQDRLDATTTTDLEQNYETHATAAATITDKVATDDAVTGADLKAKLATLSAQGDVLAAIGERDNNASKDNARHFAERTHGTLALGASVASEVPIFAAPVVSDTHLALKATSESSASLGTDATADVLKTQAEKALADLQAQFKSQSSSLDASTSAQFSARIDAISNALTAVSADNALDTYQKALSTIAKLQTFLKANALFKGNLLAPLLRHGDESDSHSSSIDRHRGGGLNLETSGAVTASSTGTLEQSEAGSSGSSSGSGTAGGGASGGTGAGTSVSGNSSSGGSSAGASGGVQGVVNSVTQSLSL